MGKSASLANRRASIRYRCAPATVGRVISTADQEFQLACVIDLSLRGIGMQVVRPIEAGRLVIVAMKSNDGRKTFELAARVMHCNAVPHEEWYIGCVLTTLLTPE